MTVFGLVLIILLIFSLFLKYKYTLGILIVSCVFTVTSAFNIGDKFIQPYLISSCFVIFRTFLDRNKVKDVSLFKYICLFIFYMFLISFISPLFFEGIIIFERDLDQAYYEGGSRLKYGINIIQIAYVIFNLVTLYCVWIKREYVEQSFLRKAFVASVCLIVLFGFWEYISKMTGIIPFPSEILLSNSGGELYTLTVMEDVMRLSSIFGEASFCGAFLAASFWGVIAMNQHHSKFLYILEFLIFICIIFNLSGTGWVALIFGGVVYVYINRLLSIRSIMRVLGLIIILGFLVFTIDYGDLVYEMLVSKSETGSGTIRTASVLNSIDVFFQTCMLGGGIGSTYSSSFLADMLAQVGMIGFILLFLIYSHVVFRYKNVKGYEYIFMYTATMLFAQATAIPDFSFSCFWFGMYLAASFYPVPNRNF